MQVTRTPTINAAALRGRGVGMLVGAGFGGWWATAALHAEPMLRVWSTEAAIAVVTGVLVAAGVATFWRGVRLAPSRHAARQPRRPTWRKFLLVLLAEIAALNILAWGLNHYHLTPCLLPAIAIIVGLHFYPLAHIFRAPYMHITATLMALAGIGAVLAILHGSPAAWPNAIAAAICAVALWVTVATGWLRIRNLPDNASAGTARLDNSR